jgi:hypothetical protein
MNWMTKRMMIISAVALLATGSEFAQNPEVQQKVAAVKEASAANKQRLRQYQWIETTQLTLKGDAKPPTKNSCLYGPDGKVQKTAIGPPPEPPSGGRMKQKIIANKKEEQLCVEFLAGAPRNQRSSGLSVFYGPFSDRSPIISTVFWERAFQAWASAAS